MAELMTYLCLVNGDSTFNAFSITVSSTDTTEDLVALIKAKTCPEFDDVPAHKLTLWSVAIPVAYESESAIALDNVSEKRKLYPTQRLSKPIRGNLSVDTIHVIVDRPPRARNTFNSFSSVSRLRVTVLPFRKTFTWTTDVDRANLTKLRQVLDATFPGQLWGYENITIVHVNTSRNYEGEREPLLQSDPKHLQTILQFNHRSGIQNLTLHWPLLTDKDHRDHKDDEDRKDRNIRNKIGTVFAILFFIQVYFLLKPDPETIHITDSKWSSVK